MCKENAASDSNRILLVTVPFVAKKYGLRMESILHSKTQTGKGPVDVHFARETRYVDLYIELQGLDMPTPADPPIWSEH